MLMASLRDLQWRRRRFAIGIVATGLVFALALVITGISSSFRNEVTRTVKTFDADAWIVPVDASGPFTTSGAFPTTVEAAVAAQPGVHAAAPVAVLHFAVHTPELHGLNVIGVVPGATGAPKVRRGHELSAPGQLALDASLGLQLGDILRIATTDFTVVGETSGVTYFAGQPVGFVSLADAQRLACLGQPLASAVVTRGVPARAPGGFRVMRDSEVKADLHRPLGNASQTIDLVRVLLWLVAAGIIGSIVYLQAIERSRDFAVMKATGTTNRALMGGLAVQATVLSAFSAVVAVVLAQLLKPLVAMRVEIPWSAYVLLPLVAIVVGLLASFTGLRRTEAVDPALAFGA